MNSAACRWSGLIRTFHGRDRGNVPVAGAGRMHRDALNLNGRCRRIGEVGGDAEGLARNGGGEGILRVGGEAGTPAIGVGRGDDRVQSDAQGFDNGAIELRLLHLELVSDIVFFLGGEGGGGYFFE